MNMRLGNSRRNRDAGFQWLIIGVVLGMGCAFSFMLGLYVFEIIEVTIDETEPPATQVVIVATAENTPTVTVPTATTDTVGVDDISAAQDDDTSTDTGIGTGDTSDPDGMPTPLPGGAAITPTPATNASGSNTGSTTNSGPPPTATIGFSLNGDTQGSGVPTTGDGAEITLTQPSVGVDGASSAPTTSADVTILLNSATPLISVEGGTFKMGTTEEEGSIAVGECVSRDAGICQQSYVIDSIPPHDVFVDDFRIEQYEVSVQQYVGFLNYLLAQNPGTSPHLTACSGPCALTTGDSEGANSDIAFDGDRYLPRPDGFDRSLFPMTFVSWQGAQAYCAAIGRSLPTEAQWERAARGTENRTYPWGFQWFADNRANTSRTGTAGEGTWEVNTVPQDSLTESGVANMAGNVAEWTADFYDAGLYQARFNSGVPFTNPQNTNPGNTVVVRGGSWDAVPLFARAVHRQDFSPNSYLPTLGFRCAAPAQ